VIASAWDKLAVCFEDARISGQSEFHWPSFDQPRFLVSVEYNGGLPILSFKDVNSGLSVHDKTAFHVLEVLEGVSK
jgi:hypothetical protein